MNDLTYKRSWAEPYKMKMVELLKMSTKPQRLKAIREAGYKSNNWKNLVSLPLSKRVA